MFFSALTLPPPRSPPSECPVPPFPALELLAAANSPVKDGIARNFPNSSKFPPAAAPLCTRQFASPLHRKAQQFAHTRTCPGLSRVGASPKQFPLRPPPANPWPPKLPHRLPHLFPAPRQCPAAPPIPDAFFGRPRAVDRSRAPPHTLTPSVPVPLAIVPIPARSAGPQLGPVAPAAAARESQAPPAPVPASHAFPNPH